MSPAGAAPRAWRAGTSQQGRTAGAGPSGRARRSCCHSAQGPAPPTPRASPSLRNSRHATAIADNTANHEAAA